MTYFTKPNSKTHRCKWSTLSVAKKLNSYTAGFIWWPDTLRSMKSYYYLLFIMIFKTFKILLGSNLLIAHYPPLSSDCLCILFPPPFACLQALRLRGLPITCLECSGSQEFFFLSSPWSDSSRDSSTADPHQGGKWLGSKSCISQIQSRT